MRQKECIAMLLAGGEGKRLGALTERLAKPAVPFGAKYRIIDFPLSNCANSGIDTVGVLTQYEPLVLNRHLGIGSPWDLDRRDGGMSILPPYMKKRGSSWYKGTAHAIYENIDYIDQFQPEYVLVLSGDHIYKMNYNDLLQMHKSRTADVTIATIEVDWSEASRFGIIHTDHRGRIVNFEEKPQVPRSNLASMGVYMFNWNVLKRYLLSDEHNPASTNDFGKDILPQMLQDELHLQTYRFSGYWKDVGTIESLWEAHMDLLADQPPIDLNDPNWRIYSQQWDQPPQYVAADATVNNSLIGEGCEIRGSVHRSVLFNGAKIGAGSIIQDSVIMPNVTIGDNVIIQQTIIDEGTVIGDHCIVGQRQGEREQITLIEANRLIQAEQESVYKGRMNA